MIKKVFLPYFMFLFLSACTSNGFIFRSSGDYKTNDIPSTGVYKIGTPYEINGVLYTPKEDYQYAETGIAGWYTSSEKQITTNGEKYDPNILSAAHKTLPLPSLVKITNLENNQSAVVRVNERGPFVNNRLIDVSQKAAEILGFELNKTTLVRVELLSDESKALKATLPMADDINSKTPVVNTKTVDVVELKPIYEPDQNFLKPIYPPQEETNPDSIMEKSEKNFYIQYGAFKNNDNALQLKEKVDSIQPAFIAEKNTETDTLYRVRSGPFENQEKALSVLDKIIQEGYGNSQVVYE